MFRFVSSKAVATIALFTFRAARCRAETSDLNRGLEMEDVGYKDASGICGHPRGRGLSQEAEWFVRLGPDEIIFRCDDPNHPEIWIEIDLTGAQLVQLTEQWATHVGATKLNSVLQVNSALNRTIPDAAYCASCGVAFSAEERWLFCSTRCCVQYLRRYRTDGVAKRDSIRTLMLRFTPDETA